MADTTKTRSTELVKNLTFLRRVKEGVYAQIDRESLKYVRIPIRRESYYHNRQEFYYGIS